MFRQGSLSLEHKSKVKYTEPFFSDYDWIHLSNDMMKEGKGSPHNSFPVTLHYVLESVETDGQSHIISWQPHGRCFLVHKREEFVKRILPNWFRQTKFASFQRQLNLYSFKRITAGPDRGAYYHEQFLRGKPFLASTIRRTTLKCNGPRKPACPEREPNFYRMTPIPKTVPTLPQLAISTFYGPRKPSPLIPTIHEKQRKIMFKPSSSFPLLSTDQVENEKEDHIASALNTPSMAFSPTQTTVTAPSEITFGAGDATSAVNHINFGMHHRKNESNLWGNPYDLNIFM